MSDNEEEASRYAFSATISSVRKSFVSANMTDNNDDDLRRWMESQEKTFRAQQEALDNIQQMLAQLLTNWNTNDTGSNHNDEEHNDDEHPKIEKSKESSTIDAEVIKGIQAQIVSLTQRDELKKVGMTRPYPLEWDSAPYPPKFKPLTLHSMMARDRPTNISITSGHKLVT